MRKSPTSPRARRPACTWVRTWRSGSRSCKQRQDVGGQRGQIHVLEAHLGARDAREHEQIVDESPHAPSRLANPAAIVERALVELVGVVLDQRLGETINGAQGGAQIVRHRVGEAFQFAVGGAQLGGSLFHALFELLVERAQGLLHAAAGGDVHAERDGPHDAAALDDGVVLPDDVAFVAGGGEHGHLEGARLSAREQP
jgi:hypothetical protein